MAGVLPDDERVTITLPVSEWVKVAAGVASLYGLDDETLNAIRRGVAIGN